MWWQAWGDAAVVRLRLEDIPRRSYWEGSAMTFDVRCFELAEFFLEDEPLLRGRTELLAQRIQEAIEEWIEATRAEIDGNGA
jgi:hypothetical protein